MQLGLPGKNLNDDIGELVARGLDPEVRISLDAVRVIGNNAVHPLQMDIHDDHETAVFLFDLVNFITDQMITHPKKRQKLFDSLPEGAKAAISKRDSG